MIKNLEEIITHYRVGSSNDARLITEIAEELDTTREALAQALYSLSRATMNDGSSGYAEIDWLESHEWWPK